MEELYRWFFFVVVPVKLVICSLTFGVMGG